MKQNEQRMILKIESKDLKKAKWKFEVNLETALDEKLIISVSESQLIRWIDKLKGRGDVNAQIKSVKSKIKKIKKNKEDTHRKEKLRKAYSKRDNLQFIPDLVNVVFPPCKNGENRDYDRANKGFTINGVRFVRLLGTPNGIKKCTILYVAEDLHADLMKRIENDRQPEKELIPAKLEAYRALTCSGSLPIPAPNGVIVVKDCLTKFKENVIVIRDSEKSPEPELTYENDYEIEHNNSDGFGLMLPGYAAKVNSFLTNGNDTSPLSGAVIRYSFTKGLLVTFDFVEFAEKIVGTYEIIDVWGTPRDLREADIILTESQLKLWDSYNSWEHFAECSTNNGYEWAATKICEKSLEDVRTSNYQFLNCYDFTDEEIAKLCAPTLNEIKKIMQLDPRATMLYLTGENKPNKENWENVDDTILSALMFAPEVINDPFVRAHIWHNISMKIERAKRGKLNFNANYAMICGDPFALCQSMFGLEITGLLKAGEVYHKYWIDKGAEEIACFRAPMTNLANVRKLRLTTAENAVYWYQHIKTACILNAWDSTLEAENGADADGDTFFTTNNKIILRNTENLPTIISIQNKAEKTIPTEADVIAANKLAFSDEIGTITNIVTEMIDLRAKYPRDTEEYKILSYRIICGQHLQQAQIDKAKGAAVKEMPEHWAKKKSDDPYNDLAATKKPYFMRRGIINQILDYLPEWRIGYVSNSALLTKYRPIPKADNVNIYSYLMNEIQKLYGCYVIFNTEDKTINLIEQSDIFMFNAGAVISWRNALKALTISNQNTKYITAMRVNTDSETFGISMVNPNGTNVIYNFDSVIDKLDYSVDNTHINPNTNNPYTLKELMIKYKADYAAQLSTYRSYGKSLIEATRKLADDERLLKQSLENYKKTVAACKPTTNNIAIPDIPQAKYQFETDGLYEPTAYNINNRYGSQELFNDVKAANTAYWDFFDTYEATQKNVAKYSAKMRAIALEFSFNIKTLTTEYANGIENYTPLFTPSEMKELQNFIVEGDWESSVITFDDNFKPNEIYNSLVDMYTTAKSEMDNIYSKPIYEFSAEIADIFRMKETRAACDSICLGNSLYIADGDNWITPILLQVNVDFDNMNGTTMLFSTDYKRKPLEYRFSKMFATIQQTSVSTPKYTFD